MCLCSNFTLCISLENLNVPYSNLYLIYGLYSFDTFGKVEYNLFLLLQLLSVTRIPFAKRKHAFYVTLRDSPMKTALCIMATSFHWISIFGCKIIQTDSHRTLQGALSWVYDDLGSGLKYLWTQDLQGILSVLTIG